MSGDEIVFEEVRFREPRRLRRPDRDRRWACAAYEVAAPDDLPVFLDREAADAIERHALRDTSVELGGILLGMECVDDLTGEPFVWVTRWLEARHYENTQASFTYTHDSWEEISRERDAQWPDLDIVGWYHTHPDFGVFLSGHDLFIQRHFFGQPLQLAYVVDPVRQARGFFQWRGGAMAQVGGFWVTADRGDRLALARFVNDLENFPTAAGPGGGQGFSPRLEAELIAMLTRPTAHHPANAPGTDRTVSAAVFGAGGALLGALGLAVVLWLGQLNSLVLDQSRAIQRLDQTARESADRQRLALDLALGDDPAGKSRDRFLEEYNRASRERDEAKKLLADRTAASDLLAARARQLVEELEGLRAEHGALKEEAASREQDAREAPALRARAERLESKVRDTSATVVALEAALTTTDGRKAAAFYQVYNRTWYVAAAGWGLSLLLGATLVVVYVWSQSETGGPTRRLF